VSTPDAASDPGSWSIRAWGIFGGSGQAPISQRSTFHVFSGSGITNGQPMDKTRLVPSQQSRVLPQYPNTV
jgi:hypothetical protein